MEPSVYCQADDGAWTIWLYPNAICREDGQWVDCYHVCVTLPTEAPCPWAPENMPPNVGISFDSYEEAWAHVNRPDLLVWALTTHAITLANTALYWRRRFDDVDPTGKKFRALEFLDDIRCAILDTGWPLGDDSDPELTPVRLVKEILARVAHLEECNKNQYDMLRQGRRLQPVLSYEVPVQDGEVTRAFFDLQGMNDFESYTLPSLFEKKETP